MIKSVNMEKLLTTILMLFLLFTSLIGCGSSSSGGSTPSSVTASAKLLLQDGTEKELSDTPLPRNVRVQIIFSEAVDTDQAESLFDIKDESENSLSKSIGWNEDSTIMTVTLLDLLDYQKTYTVSITAGTASVSASTKSDVDSFEETFQTMTRHDINGDGKADLTVEAEYWEAGSDIGRGYIFYGDELTTGPSSASTAKAIITGEATGDFMSIGWLVSEDFNGDGFADPIFFTLNGGADYIFYGFSAENPIEDSLSAVNNANLVLEEAVAWDELFLDAVADLNGDGHYDILTDSSQAYTRKGAANIFFGPDFVSETAASADVEFVGEAENDYLGWPASAYGDMNGDNINDTILNAGGYDSSKGRIYIFFGATDLSGSYGAASANVIITGDSNNGGNLGYLKETRDLNGDGIDDLITNDSTYDTNTGRIYIFFGATDFSSRNAADAEIMITGEANNDRFSNQTRVADVTGDGADDIIATGQNFGTGVGKIYFFDGTGLTNMSAAQANAIFTGENASDNMSIRTTGDINGDGVDDIIASAANYPGGTELGRIYIFLGGSGLTTKGAADADIILTGEQNGAAFTCERVMDVNGDGVMDIIAGAGEYDSNRGRGYVFYGGASLASKTADLADVILEGENQGDGFSD